MKKQMKKWLSAALVLMMAVGMLSGCGKKATPENLLKDMSENVKKVKSASSNIVMDLSMSMDGESAAIKIDMDMDQTMDPAAAYAKGELSMSMSGTDMTTEMESYQVKEDGEYVVYTGTDGAWTKSSVDADELENAFDTEMFSSVEDMAENFTLEEKLAKVNKEDCFVLDGVIQGDMITEMLGSDFFDSMGLQDLIDEDAFEDAEIPYKIYIYKKDILPAKISVDMKDIMLKLYEDAGAEGVEMEACQVEMTYKNFDKVDKIKIPDDVKDAADSGSSTDTEDDSKSSTNTEAAEQSKDLKDTWDSYTVQINDKVVTLPCTLADIEAAGLTLDTDYTPENYIINANEYNLAYFLDANGNEIMVDVINMTDEAKELKDCLVGGISVDDYDVESGGLTVIFPGGFQIGSAKDDVLAKYGEASDVYEGDSMHMYTWYAEDSYYNSCEIDFDPETLQAISMNIQHYE